ncbi:hypothetical protein GF312_01660 [Candidatus Poribacteria bacterium]|nr:hypothetical protein [Candidatus Poribacteria bacterium]
MNNQKVITIFGSSKASKLSRRYKEAYLLGKLLAQAGFAVCNGGYSGTMDAAAKGAVEADGKTIGITVKTFRKKPSEWTIIQRQADNYMERMMMLAMVADAYVVLEGGIGTLSEMTFVWVLNAVKEIKKPIILIGEAWKNAIDGIIDQLMIKKSSKDLLIMVDTPEQAVEILKETLG